MMTQSALTVGVGIVLAVLVAVVKSGLPQAAFQWWLRRRAAGSSPAGGPPSPASPAEAAPATDAPGGMTLDELAKLFIDRKARQDEERRRAEEILAGKMEPK